jgi:hypothetical protein
LVVPVGINEEAAAAFRAEGAFDPGVVAEFADLFPNARLVVQPNASTFPGWMMLTDLWRPPRRS